MVARSAEALVSHHEAAHAVVGAFFGMRPSKATLQPHEIVRAHVLSDQQGLVDSLPGNEIQRLLIWSCVRVVQLAAGACAELRLGNPHEDCGWAGDMRQFEPLIMALARLTGRSYDDCWWMLCGAAENLLACDALWTIVEALAARLRVATELSAEEISAIIDEPIRNLVHPAPNAVIRELAAWIDTPTRRSVVSDPDAIASLASA